MSVQAIPAATQAAQPIPVPLTEADHKAINRLTGWNIGIAIGALTIGAWLGVLQGLEHTGLDLYKYLAPGLKSYYQGLTIHGGSMRWSGQPSLFVDFLPLSFPTA
jgi:cytochrome c oxidase subunit I